MANGKENVEYLDQSRVTKYAKLKALISKWTKAAEVLNKVLKAGLEAGHRCPKGGPWLVVLTPTDRSTVSWKEEWEKLAAKVYGTRWPIEQERIQRENKVPSYNLNVEVNPDWKSEPVATQNLDSKVVGMRKAR